MKNITDIYSTFNYEMFTVNFGSGIITDKIALVQALPNINFSLCKPTRCYFDNTGSGFKFEVFLSTALSEPRENWI